MYKKINLFLQKFFKKSSIFKFLFNISPMYRRSCGKIVEISDDIFRITVHIRLNYKNRNYVGSMFGGSMFSAADPILMIQFLELLEHKYVVWDKSASIQFKKPPREDVWINFIVEPTELKNIIEEAEKNGSYTFFKTVALTNKEGTVEFATVEKELYVATKAYYRERRKEKQKAN